ncbi:MAG: sigma-70 family RNA polymerase sigma factor [Phycisphaerales bacterium]|nr:MAG: sigma-70 family RNA polymerase sigma factor [Phycisphaerales bacterium]
MLRKARCGSKDSMAKLAMVVWDQMYPFFLRKTRDHEQTHDLLQETVLTMIQQLDSLRCDDSFWLWIRRIASSKMSQHFRGQQR